MTSVPPPARPTPATSTARSAERSQPATLNELYQHWARDGWTNRELGQFMGVARHYNLTQSHPQAVWRALLNPTLPEHSNHTGGKFFEALAWYMDTTLSNGDGRFDLTDLRRALVAQGRRYVQQSFQNAPIESRLQTYKMIQKLKLLEREIASRVSQGHPRHYPYRPRAMRAIDPNTPFNRTNTIRSAEDFQKRVFDASFQKPVLIKAGLPYCTHCLLLEHLESVPAIAQRYGHLMDVYKVWYNPNDPAKAGINEIVRKLGVTSSPTFVVIDKGQVHVIGYAFPDERGDGIQALLRQKWPNLA